MLFLDNSILNRLDSTFERWSVWVHKHLPLLTSNYITVNIKSNESIDGNLIMLYENKSVLRKYISNMEMEDSKIIMIKGKTIRSVYKLNWTCNLQSICKVPRIFKIVKIFKFEIDKFGQFNLAQSSFLSVWGSRKILDKKKWKRKKNEKDDFL